MRLVMCRPTMVSHAGSHTRVKVNRFVNTDTGTGVDREPDYRFTLANERTFLAWNRTALALIASGVAIVQLVPAFRLPGTRHAVGAILVVLGVAVATASYRRWQAVQQAMRRDGDLPATKMPLLLTVGLSALAVAVIVLLLITR
jgi:putative membrane protein